MTTNRGRACTSLPPRRRQSHLARATTTRPLRADGRCLSARATRRVVGRSDCERPATPLMGAIRAHRARSAIRRAVGRRGRGRGRGSRLYSAIGNSSGSCEEASVKLRCASNVALGGKIVARGARGGGAQPVAQLRIGYDAPQRRRKPIYVVGRAEESV